MGKGVQRFEPLYEDFKHMPGIFEPGSDLDHSLIETRKNSTSIFGQDRDISEPQLGARRQHQHLNFETSIIHTDAAPEWVKQCEVIWLITLDTRIRFCRWFLNHHSLPHDKDEALVRSDGNFGWVFHGNNFDPEDYMKVTDIFRYFLPRIETELYYSMKFLAHFRRVEQIVDSPPIGSDIWVALGREFYLMGELWSEISFLSKHLKNLVSGQKQELAGKKGREMRTDNSFASQFGAAAQDRARELLDEKPLRTWGGIQKKLAAEFGVSQDTIKKNVRNPKKT